MLSISKKLLMGASLAVLALSSQAKEYGPGVTDTEIKIGNIMPYSGPASAYGVIGKAEAAYFQYINDQGGINGRKIEFVSLDDGYSPPKAVEQTRKLVEQDEVLLVFQALGTPSNSAVQKYMNSRKVPQLFVATGASKWNDPENFHWTMGWQPTYFDEAVIYAKHVLKNDPDAKIGILYQNDDFGKDYLDGFKAGLGDKYGSMVVAEISYEVTDPTIDSQMVSLKGSGADTFFNITTPKFAAQAIKKAAEIDWTPVHYMTVVSASIGAVLEPAGLENAKGIYTGFYLKDATDPQWQDDPGLKDWTAWMDKYLPTADKADGFYVFGYTVAQTMVQVLKQAGDELTRENIMKQAANLDLELPMLLPGIRIKTSETDYGPIQSLQIGQFNGTIYELSGEIIGQ
ncbi:MAG: ABC transporter substrate-binding protein [Burkholderiaceae bacterium]